MDNKMYGQIIALFKNLMLNQSNDTIHRTTSILSLPQQGLTEFHRIQAREIWFTSKTEEHLKILVKYLNILNETRLICKDVPKKELEELILSTLSTEAFRCNYFSADSIMFKHDTSLLECRLIDDKITFAKEFFKDVIKKLKSKQTNWLNIIPLIKIKLNSFELEYDGITIIKRCDKEFWNNFTKNYSICTNYDICSLNIQGTVTSLYNDIVVLCKNFGSQKYAKLDAELKLKKFISILFSFISIENDYKFFKSEYTEKTWCIQLPLNSVGNNIQGSYSSNLLPCYIKDYIEDNVNINNIQEYYKLLETKSDIIKNRVLAATTYINQAMNSLNETDIFLNYYISLDALFGIEFRVEESIKKGVELLIEDTILKEKATLLYKLRNDLVHGGSRYIEEWSEFENYYHKFKNNDILTDIEKLAFECLNKYPYKITDSFFDNNYPENKNLRRE